MQTSLHALFLTVTLGIYGFSLQDINLGKVGELGNNGEGLDNLVTCDST